MRGAHIAQAEEAARAAERGAARAALVPVLVDAAAPSASAAHERVRAEGRHRGVDRAEHRRRGPDIVIVHVVVAGLTEVVGAPAPGFACAVHGARGAPAGADAHDVAQRRDLERREHLGERGARAVADLSIVVLTPAGHAAASDRAVAVGIAREVRDVAQAGDRHDGEARRLRGASPELAVAVAAPAGERLVGEDRAGARARGRDARRAGHTGDASGRLVRRARAVRELPRVVLAPAGHASIAVPDAAEAVAERDLDHVLEPLTGHREARADARLDLAPARDLAVRPDGAGERPARGDLHGVAEPDHGRSEASRSDGARRAVAERAAAAVAEAVHLAVRRHAAGARLLHRELRRDRRDLRRDGEGVEHARRGREGRHGGHADAPLVRAQATADAVMPVLVRAPAHERARGGQRARGLIAARDRCRARDPDDRRRRGDVLLAAPGAEQLGDVVVVAPALDRAGRDERARAVLAERERGDAGESGDRRGDLGLEVAACLPVAELSLIVAAPTADRAAREERAGVVAADREARRAREPDDRRCGGRVAALPDAAPELARLVRAPAQHGARRGARAHMGAARAEPDRAAHAGHDDGRLGVVGVPAAEAAVLAEPPAGDAAVGAPHTGEVPPSGDLDRVGHPGDRDGDERGGVGAGAELPVRVAAPAADLPGGPPDAGVAAAARELRRVGDAGDGDEREAVARGAVAELPVEVRARAEDLAADLQKARVVAAEADLRSRGRRGAAARRGAATRSACGARAGRRVAGLRRTSATAREHHEHDEEENRTTHTLSLLLEAGAPNAAEATTPSARVAICSARATEVASEVLGCQSSSR